jgi:O-antigen/teichoic acid export membrane protein
MSATLQKRMLGGSAVGLAAYAANMAQAFLTLPLLLTAWDNATYGIWMTILSTQTLFTCLDQGHQAFLGSEFNMLVVADRHRLQEVLASALQFTLWLGCIEILTVSLLAAGGWLAPLTGVGTGDAARYHVDVCLAVLVADGIISGSAAGIVARLYTSFGQFVRGSIWGLVLRMVLFAVTVTTALLGGSLLAVCVTTSAFHVLLMVIIMVDLRKRTDEVYPWWKGGSLRKGIKNFVTSFTLTGSNLLEQFSYNGLVLIVARQLGPAVVPVFTTLRTIANAAQQGGAILLQPLQPDLARYHVKREPAKIIACFDSYWFLLLAGTVVIMMVVPYVETLHRFWTRGRLPFDWSLFACIGWAVLARVIQTPVQWYFSSVNALRPQVLIAALRAGLTLGAAAWLIPHWGLIGAGFALVIAEVFASLIVTFVLARGSLARLGGHLPFHHLVFAFAPAGIAGVAFAAIVWLGTPRSSWPAWIAVLVLVPFAIRAWSNLPVEVKRRVGDLAASHVPYWRQPPTS